MGFKLEVVKDSGALWRNQKVEQVVKMLGKKTRLLDVLDQPHSGGATQHCRW